MSTVSRRRRTATAVVAASTLLLAGALPAAAQTASQSPSAGAGQSGQSATTPGGGSGAGVTSGPSAPGQSPQRQMKPQTGKSSRGAGLSQAQLRKHARADVMLEQKAPEVYATVAQANDINKELSTEERQKLSLALQGSGYTLAQYAREHRQIMASPRMQARLQQMAQQVKAQAGQKGQPGGGATSGAGATPGAGGTSGGAASPSTGGGTSGGAASPSTGGGTSGSQSTQPSGSASPATK